MNQSEHITADKGRWQSLPSYIPRIMHFILGMLNYVRIPVKYKRIFFDYKDREFNLLDVGCGFHSAAKAKKYFKLCHYYGIDREKSSNDEADFNLMKRFFMIDLDSQPLEEVPSAFFDVVLFSHVIEHLYNGLNVLDELAAKVKPGGIIYIEFPGIRSFSTPTGDKSCLHFCDDPTHVKVYEIYDIINILLRRRFKILKAGTRRDKVRVLMTPALIIRGVLKGEVWGTGLWDWFGFAEYVYARKAL